MLKLTLTVSAAVSLLATLIATPALADCDQDWTRLAEDSTPAYAHTVAQVESWGADVTFPECEVAAEETDCEAEYLFGQACDAKHTRIYLSCVAAEVCREAVQGWLEDDGVSGSSLESMATACTDLVVVAAGGMK